MLDVKSADASGFPFGQQRKLIFVPLGETFGSKQHCPMRCLLWPLRSMLQKASSLASGSKRWNMIFFPSGVKEGSSSQAPGAGEFNQAVAIGIHNRHIGAFTGRIVLKNDPAPVWGPSWRDSVATQKRDLL